MPNGTYWWCERGIKFPLLDSKITGGTQGEVEKIIKKA